jgi:cyanophycinase-like exopeptidase
MKLFLFGGAETGQAKYELKMIEKVIKRTKTKQVLHIPFARIKTDEPEWMPGWFNRNVKLEEGVEYLNADYKNDITKANNPLVFISGGSNSANLLKKLNNNPALLSLIKNASYIIGESAGAKILAEYSRIKDSDGIRKIVKGLGIIEDTIIEPHYAQRGRKKLLIEEIKQTNVKYGLGIDSITAAEFDPQKFPEKIKKIGDGLVEIKSL